MKKVLALGIIVLLLPLFTFAGNFPDFSKDKPKNISIGEFEINITEINSTINETGINTTINETEKPDDNSTIEPEEVKPTLTPEVKPNNTLSPINAFLTANITEPIEILEEQQILGIKRYAYASSKLVAEQRENEIIYYHQDRLSNRLITDQSGNVIRTSKYFPFGQEITSEINPGFAQKELDESNIQYFGGRYYDPNLGRFTSADPIKVENNFYVYSRNNPLTYHDPNGKRSEKIETAPEFHHIINTRHAWDRNQEIGARTRAGNGFHGAFDLLGQVQEHYWYQVEDNPIAQKIFEDGYSVYWAQRGYGELKEVMGEEYTRTGTEIYLDLKTNFNSKLIKSLKFHPIKKIKYFLRALPEEIANGISTSAVFSAWNAAIYVNQISDIEILKIENNNKHIKPTQEIIKKHNGLWFNDEILVIEKK